jgi:hypothetical protein
VTALFTRDCSVTENTSVYKSQNLGVDKLATILTKVLADSIEQIKVTFFSDIGRVT